MRTTLLPLAAIALAFAFPHAVSAAFTEFFFSTEQSDRKCPDVAFDCPPPQVCAHDSLVDKYYCCGPGGDAVCWTDSIGCNAQALECGEGQNAYCCLDGREMCTQRTGQINVCWATADNPILPFDADFVNETFSSLEADEPSATRLPFKLDDLRQETTTSTSSTSTPSSSSSQTLTPAPSDSDSDDSDPDPSPSLSGGVIAGIVIGVLAALAILATIAFLLYRRKRRASTIATSGGEGAGAGASAYETKHTYASGPGAEGVHEVFVPPAEMDGGRAVGISEMEGSAPGGR